MAEPNVAEDFGAGSGPIPYDVPVPDNAPPGSGTTKARPPVPPAPIGGDPLDPTALAKAEAPMYERYAHERAGAESVMERGMQDDLQHLKRLQSQEEHAPGELHDWNTEFQKDKYAAHPVDSFGSIGVVFAMLASAFTHQPMINALNGGAAALNALKENKDEEYKRAFDAWKANTDLAIKRQQIQHEAYQDAFKIFDEDTKLGSLKVKEVAQRFNDQQMLFYLENGMDEKIIETATKRENLTKELIQNSELNSDYTFRKRAFDGDQRVLSGNPQQVLAAWNQYFGKTATTAEQQAVQAYVSTTPPPTDPKAAEEYTKGLAKIHQEFGLLGRTGSVAGQQAQFMTQRVQELTGQGMSQTEAMLQAERDWQEAQKSATKEGAVRERAKEIRKADPSISPADAQAQARLESVTGGKNYTKAEAASVVHGPQLMDALHDLYEMADVTGLVTGELSAIAAKYGEVNDPAAVWQVALNKAYGELAGFEGSGKTSVLAMKEMLDRLPKTYQSTGFNRKQVSDTLQSYRSELQSELNLLQSEGKIIPPEEMEKFNRVGVFPQSQQKVDPIQQLRKDPNALSLDQITDLRRQASQLSPEERKLLKQEIDRREQEWARSHSGGG